MSSVTHMVFMPYRYIYICRVVGDAHNIHKCLWMQNNIGYYNWKHNFTVHLTCLWHCLVCLKSLLRESNTVAQWLHVRLSTLIKLMSLVIRSQKYLKSSGPSTFVITSASWSLVETATSFMVPFSMCSRRKWCLMSMCFDRFIAVTFSAIFCVARLSSYTMHGFETFMPMVRSNM